MEIEGKCSETLHCWRHPRNVDECPMRDEEEGDDGDVVVVMVEEEDMVMVGTRGIW